MRHNGVKNFDDTRAVGVIVCLAGMFAAGHFFAKMSFDLGVGIGLAVLARGVVSVVCAGAVAAALLTRADFMAGAASSAMVGVLSAAQSWALYEAVAASGAGAALSVFHCFPIMLLFAHCAKFGRRPHGGRLAVMSALLLCLWVSQNGAAAAGFGLAMALLSAGLNVGVMFSIENRLAEFNPVSRAFWMLAGALGGSAVFVAASGASLAMPQASAVPAFSGLVFFFVVPIGLFLFLGPRLVPSRNSAAFGSEPVWATVYGMLAAGTAPDVWQGAGLAGACLCIAGLLVVSRRAASAQAAG